MSHAVEIGIPIEELRPTQMTVGVREVELKRRQWREADAEARAKLLRRHVLPAVVGPKGRRFITDHHHTARALLEEDAGPVAVFVVADLGHLPKRQFWSFLDNSGWCHAYDADGQRRDLHDIPKRLGDLVDDPYRSLAGALIREGGCAKSTRPFAEFLRADHLRRRVDRAIVKDDWDQAVTLAMEVARDDDARALPGWCGANPAGL